MNEKLSMETAELWKPFTYFLGRWRGVGSGMPGHSKVEREYRYVLDSQFIQLNDRAVYEPQEKNPEGEVHEEIGYISYDSSRQKFILREFHVEGYINQYVLEELDPDCRKLIFITEAMENGPSGWQARTTYEILGEHAFRETFELGVSGQEMRCYITIEFSRDLPPKNA